ncbi:MAG: NAD(P)/FAD-dependent oxidoreductase [Limnohabitans sp.]|jgi:sulfide dehydrogenase [flavocytochrome c] flavoprotein subunit|nr:NAD(P)/FAD-dependent oxidoreductase [Limnohabitans sp.]
MNRRHFLGVSSGASLGLLAGCASNPINISKANVVVVGGGYGGATAAKYIRLFSNNSAQVTLIEPNTEFISCPMSNLVVGGHTSIANLSTPYDNLSKRHGIKVVKDMVTSIDAKQKTVRLASGATIKYDKLVLSPGIDMMMDRVEGLQKANQEGVTVQAWKAGPETVLLRKQLESMKDGGVYAISVPTAPYRCPPGPYERACQVASYFKQFKPKSKVLILDANDDVTSKGGLFKKAWASMYPGMIEYRPKHNVVAIDSRKKVIKFDVQDDVKADVLNILPMMRAGNIAVQSGLANSNARWVNVNYINFESTAAKDIHVLGDSIQVAPLMPKSGHMANSHAKVAAAAVVAELGGLEINQTPVLTNTCYSFISADEVVHVASVHQYDAKDKTFKTVPGSGGLSAGASKLEGVYAWGWARNIWADSLG